MFTFEWDDAKAASNQRKHRIAFDEAVTVFADVLALTFTDSDHPAAKTEVEPSVFRPTGGCSSWSIPNDETTSAS